MNEFWFIIMFLAWYILALVVAERSGKKSRLGEEWTFFISFMLSPLAGWIASRWIAGKKRNA